MHGSSNSSRHMLASCSSMRAASACTTAVSHLLLILVLLNGHGSSYSLETKVHCADYQHSDGCMVQLIYNFVRTCTNHCSWLHVKIGWYMWAGDEQASSSECHKVFFGDDRPFDCLRKAT
jgi:hypothetical protein